MRAIIILLFAVLFIQCNSVKSELGNLETNKKVVQQAYPSSHVEVVRGFNYIFMVSNPDYVKQVIVKENKIAETTTLKSFNTTTVSSAK